MPFIIVCTLLTLIWPHRKLNNNKLFRIAASPKCFSVGSCKNYVEYDTIQIYNTIQLVSSMQFFTVLNLGREWVFLIVLSKLKSFEAW